MSAQEQKPTKVTTNMMDAWATDSNGPVALHLRQKLVPVEGENGVIFPPTYAGSGYNIDTLSDGKKVATIDSVGSQANRMEPQFREEPLKELVQQIEVTVDGSAPISLFEVGHRLGDALVRSTELATEASAAFEASRKGDFARLAKLAPTSIVFGAWDSRDTQAKLPRLVQSVIRAWDVEELHRSATYIPPVDYAKHEVFSEDEKAKAEGNTKSPLAQRGFVHVPSTNAPGGVMARGPIWRDVTINLVALRRLARAKDGKDENAEKLRRYVLGLSLAVATQPIEGFLRQGCLLTLDRTATHQWVAVMRDGAREPVGLDEKLALDYAKEAAGAFGVGEPRTVAFNKALAKQDSQEAKGKKGKRAKEQPAVMGSTDGGNGS